MSFETPRTHAALLTILLLLSGCASGPQPPQKGTPAFYWLAAQETFATADYTKTVDHLYELTKSQNEYTDRALPWRLVLLSGLTKGHMDLADIFETGAKANRANPTPFRKQMIDHRQQANRLALQFAEVFEKWEAANASTTEVPYAMPNPKGNPAESPYLAQVRAGKMPQQGHVDNATQEEIDRQVLLATSRSAGFKEDVAKTAELLKGGAAKVPRPAFVTAMATALYDMSQLYAPKKLDTPDREKFFLQHAGDALKGLPSSPEVKELSKNIGVAQKKLKVKS